MMIDTSVSRLREFLQQHNTMTLATVDPGGQPQAAAVFYAADRQLNLYFLSSPSCRHSRNLTENGRVAATIQADGQDWRTIRGIQIEGAAEQITGAGKVAHAAGVYVARFDFLRGVSGLVSELSDAASTGGVSALRGALADSRFYVLRPLWFRLIDNTLGFGHKEEIRADELRRGG
jgi:uncharacterized protein YhbP (UPF0306 family)